MFARVNVLLTICCIFSEPINDGVDRKSICLNLKFSFSETLKSHKNEMQSPLHVDHTRGYAKYLDIPPFLSDSKTQDFKFILNKVG